MRHKSTINDKAATDLAHTYPARTDNVNLQQLGSTHPRRGSAFVKAMNSLRSNALRLQMGSDDGSDDDVLEGYK